MFLFGLRSKFEIVNLKEKWEKSEIVRIKVNRVENVRKVHKNL